jgi:hypothetical protein
MSAPERQLRSALSQLLSRRGVVHGTLIVRRRVCGKPTCRCAKGQLHEGLYLVVTEQGKPRQMYVPRPWEAALRQWIDNYGRARGLLDELSRLHWDKVRRRQE